MSIDLITYTGRTVTSKDDAIVYDMMIGQSGIANGCELTFMGANQVKIADGRGIIKGRMFTVSEQTIQCQMSDSGSKNGRIYVQMDLSNTEEPISIKTVAASTLPDLVQEKDCNYTNGIWEMELATYTTNETQISNLTTTFLTIDGIDVLDSLEEIQANTDKGRIAGALAVKELNNNLTANNETFKFAYSNDDSIYGWRDSGGAFHPFGNPYLRYNEDTGYIQVCNKALDIWFDLIKFNVPMDSTVLYDTGTFYVNHVYGEYTPTTYTTANITPSKAYMIINATNIYWNMTAYPYCAEITFTDPIDFTEFTSLNVLVGTTTYTLDISNLNTKGYIHVGGERSANASYPVPNVGNAIAAMIRISSVLESGYCTNSKQLAYKTIDTVGGAHTLYRVWLE